jgi:hypothetical protein
VQIRVLGTVEAQAGDELVPLGPRQPRLVLGLWRGPVLADVAEDRTRDLLASGVEETRLVAIEDRVDALLRLGGHRDVVEELVVLVDANPTRERLVGQLMLALHRGGRAGEALEVFRRTRAYLAEELGIDPGGELRRLELANLRNDDEPALMLDGAEARRHAQGAHTIATRLGMPRLVAQTMELLSANA